MQNNWKENISNWPGSLPTIEVNHNKSALILIDMQNYYIHEDGKFRSMMKKSYPNMERFFINHINENIIPSHKKLLNYFRQHELPIFHVRVGSILPNGKDQFKRRRLRDERRANLVGNNNKKSLVKNTFQHEIIKELSPLENEFILDKNSSSAFNSTAIDQFLRNTESEFLLIGGILTNNCVEATARDAADKGYNVALIEDGCATLDEETQNSTYKTFSRTYGRVENTDAILKTLLESATSNKIITW